MNGGEPNRWPWFLGGLIATGMAASLLLLVLALMHPPINVRGDDAPLTRTSWKQP